MESTYKEFYGFRNKATGLFKRDYRTIQGTKKNACFKTRPNAQKTLILHMLQNSYEVAIMAKTEKE